MLPLFVIILILGMVWLTWATAQQDDPIFGVPAAVLAQGYPAPTAVPTNPYPGANGLGGPVPCQFPCPSPPTHTPIPATSPPLPTGIRPATATPGGLPTATPTPWATPTQGTSQPLPTTTGTPGTPVARQGLAPAAGHRPYMLVDRHNFGNWQYYWSLSVPLPTQAPGLEHVPMIGAPPPRSTVPSQTKLNNAANNTLNNYWLVFNEPEWASSRMKSPPYMAALGFHQEILPAILTADPDAQIIIGGVMASNCGMMWMAKFAQAFLEITGKPIPVAGWHFHLYPNFEPLGEDTNTPIGDLHNHFCDYSNFGGGDGTYEGFLAQMAGIKGFVWQYGDPDDEVWITEMNCGITCDVASFMTQVTGWLNSDEGRWVSRYAWYADQEMSYINKVIASPHPLTPTPSPLTPTPIAMHTLVPREYQPNYSLYHLTSTPTAPCGLYCDPSIPHPTPGAILNHTVIGDYYSRITPAPPRKVDWFISQFYLPFISTP